MMAARVFLIAVVLAFVFIQLASSQTDQACRNAIDTLMQCTDDTICRNPCRGYANNVINTCGTISGEFIVPSVVRYMHNIMSIQLASYI